MKKSWLTVSGGIGLLTHAFAQTPAPMPQEDLEQIEITGQRSTLSLRSEIRHTEQRMFDLFNELNSNDDFDVACGNRTPTGSKLPVWQCEAAFMRQSEALELSNAINADGVKGGLRESETGCDAQSATAGIRLPAKDP